VDCGTRQLWRLPRFESRGGTILAPHGSLPMERPVRPGWRSIPMNGIIYLVGLIVVIMFILSFLGLR
jgi:hypothetical protein